MAKKKEIIFGIRAVEEALRSGQEFERIYFRKGLQGELANKIISEVRHAGIPLQFVPPEKLNQFTRKNHQGMVALISPILYHKLDQLVQSLFEAGKVPLLMILDGISDVRNFGAIARSAECAGVHGLIIPQSGSARIHEDAVKTSAGALLSVPVCRVPRLTDAVKYLKNSGIRLFAATGMASDYYYQVDFRNPSAIVVGSEEKGLHPSIHALCDEDIAIPLYGQISSLNVSVAASLLMFEAVRQREA